MQWKRGQGAERPGSEADEPYAAKEGERVRGMRRDEAP